MKGTRGITRIDRAAVKRDHGTPADLDYLSVDSESSRCEFLRSLDFGRYEPCVVTVEYGFNEFGRNLIRDLPVSRGDRRELEDFSKWDE